MKQMIITLLMVACLPGVGRGQVEDSVMVAKRVDSLIQLNRLMVGQKKNEDAMQSIKLAEQEALVFFGNSHPLYARCLFNHGRTAYAMSSYKEAELIYLKCIDIQANSIGEEHLEYVSTLNNLAAVYLRLSLYFKAERLYLEVVRIRAKLLGEEHVDHIKALNNLSGTYLELGDYDRAEIIILKTIDIQTKSHSRDDRTFSQSLENLAGFYFQVGDFEKAELVALEALEIRSKLIGKDQSYASALGNLSSIYQRKREYAKALALAQEALIIKEQSFGMNHPLYALDLANLSSLYFYTKDYEKAEDLCLEAMEINEKLFGKNHPSYAQSLSILAFISERRGGRGASESLHLEANEILIKALGKENPEYVQSLFNLALVHQDLQKAATRFLEMNDLNRQLIEKAATYSSEKQMHAYLNTFSHKTAAFQSFSQSHPTPELIQSNYNNSLFYNGFLQENARRLSRSVESADSLTRDAYERWQACHRRLAAEYAKPIAERRYVAEVTAEAEGYEKTLTRTIASFNESRQAPRWQEVQSALNPNEVAVEFIHYNYISGNKYTDSTLYAALILRPGWTAPRMVTLFEQRQIQPLLAAANNATTAGQLYTAQDQPQKLHKRPTRGDKEEGIVIPDAQSASLYQLIWAPIDSLLQGASTIYYAPSGQLHRLQMNAIAIPNTKQTLADKYALVQLGSTRQLVVSGQTTHPTAQTAVLFGGLKYDLEKSAEIPDSAVQTRPAYDVAALRSALGDPGGSDWTYLPGTEKEMESVAQTLRKKKYSVQTLRGSEGSETAFKMLGKMGNPAPRVLHIATHGFFFPDPKDTTQLLQPFSDREPVFKTSDNPLLRSGLVLAGANPAWAGGKTPEGEEDGILTAYEISQMNLTGTELVVLSACETGLGDVDDSEGVYGLKRAFKIAGAKYLIMSLWQVPDKQTQELMSIFYKNWLNRKMDIPRAFAAAQQSMRKRYADPFFWAGFVLVE